MPTDCLKGNIYPSAATADQTQARPEPLRRQFGRAFGVLSSIRPDEECIIAQIGLREVVLPVELEERLRPFLGQKIGMVRLEEKYLVRRAEP